MKYIEMLKKKPPKTSLFVYASKQILEWKFKNN